MSKLYKSTDKKRTIQYFQTSRSWRLFNLGTQTATFTQDKLKAQRFLRGGKKDPAKGGRPLGERTASLPRVKPVTLARFKKIQSDKGIPSLAETIDLIADHLATA
jgi:hypothetical protein